MPSLAVDDGLLPRRRPLTTVVIPIYENAPIVIRSVVIRCRTGRRQVDIKPGTGEGDQAIMLPGIGTNGKFRLRIAGVESF